MGLFSRNNFPSFWMEYEKTIKVPIPSEINRTTFVVFDTETTGLTVGRDRILSIGAVKVIGESISAGEVFECYLEQDRFDASVVSVHGIRMKGIEKKVKESEAIEEFVKYIGNAVLVAHHANFDVSMINEALKRMNLPKLRNRVVDTSDVYRKFINSSPGSLSLDHLAGEFKIPLHDRHTATGDAYITSLLFLKILSRIEGNRTLRSSDLFLERSLNRGLL